LVTNFVRRQILSGKRKRRRDSLILHCIGRAVAAANGWQEAQQQFDAGTLKVSNLAAAKATPKATRVAAFIVEWALAMRDEGVDEYTITQYQRYWREGERQTYRHQREFRELWPEFDTPNELARQILKHVDGAYIETRQSNLPLSVPVLA
jgi:hypothetical protein